MPTRDLNTSELYALDDFLDGFQKRLVLISEYNPWGSSCSTSLNKVCDHMYMYGRFSYLAAYHPARDSGTTSTGCSVTSTHYLMSGVTKLGDILCSKVLNTGSHGVTALSLTRDGSAEPWVAEEDMLNGGSRILIQDTDLFNSCYRYSLSNARFVRNLCTVFRR